MFIWLLFKALLRVGIMRDTEQGILNLKKYGCIINISQVTINANIIVLWSGNLFDYLP